MNFDIIFIDMTTPFSYELNTLATRGIGGTEATVIRVAEGLGQIGFKTAVLQHNLDLPLEGKHAFYLPLSYIDKIDPPTVMVMLRGVQFVDRFPRAKKISYHQDVPNNLMLQMRDTFIKHDVTVLAASKWHKHAIQELICYPNETVNPRVKYVYNPVPDVLYIPKEVEVKYDKNKVVFPFSPHKGLDRAVELMERYIDVSGNKDMRMHIFNPGYFFSDKPLPSFVINHGPVPCAELWQHVSESLCVFYPTDFKETFCCIAAESNAVHTPLLTHEIAALAETVSGHGQFVKKTDKAIIKTLTSWYDGNRPKVWGHKNFKHSKVISDWIKLFAEIA